ncbi:MAG: YicC family protein [Thermodesulfovibrionales bacterium]|nr:YicC family protein [Thermodesulfovibrionales bacterium]
MLIQSMTGFGSAEAEGLKVEIRSLNHRYIEISLKMPHFLMEHDLTIRNLIKSKFQRGKIDVTITFAGKDKNRFTVDKEFAKELYLALQDLKKELGLKGKLDINSLLNFRDVILLEQSEYNKDVVLNTVKSAIEKLYEMRVHDGEAILKNTQALINSIRDRYEKIKDLFIKNAEIQKENLTKKIKQNLSNLPLDEIRLYQEIAFLAQRTDINEEIIRLQSHIDKFCHTIKVEDAVGRKLDFLLQEILREVNTLASKTDIIDIINETIEIKSEVEKLRELAQNLQ